MLVIISDLHLSDNSFGRTIDAGACRMLHSMLLELAAQASWRADGCYRPLDRIDIVLLGDILDIIQSDFWIKNEVRPWPDPFSRKTIDAVSNITDRILKANSEFALNLRELSRIPIVATSASPDSSRNSDGVGASRSIPLRMHYMVGECDWPLHLPGAGYDLVRHKVMQTLGLANAFDRPFPTKQHESAELDQILSAHGVYAHHGNAHDPISHFADPHRPCLANVLSVELLQRFVMETAESAGKGLPAALATRLLELFDRRPIQNVARYLNALLADSIRSPSLLRRYRENWNTAVGNALEVFKSQHSTSTDQSATLRELAGSLFISTKTVEESNPVPDSSEFTAESLREHAQAEPALQKGQARYAVYGHAQQHDYCALPTKQTIDGPVEQIYFNCGSWRPSFPSSVNANKPYSSRPEQQFSMLVFYKEDERCGRPYETWHGTLAPPRPVERPVVIHKPENSFRAVRSMVKASAINRPHFLAPADAKPLSSSSRTVEHSDSGN